MNEQLKEKINRMRDELYRRVKNADGDAYVAAVRVGELANPIYHPHGTDILHICAEVEAAAMSLADQLIDRLDR